MINILFICPGGQTNLNSPSEHLAIYINENYPDINIDIFNQTFRKLNNIEKQYDIVWGDMDGCNVPSVTISIANKLGIPSYIHGEWIPPYRYEHGWTEYFNEPTRLELKQNYQKNIEAMQSADLVSLAIESTPGGFKYIQDKTGHTFKNYFVRYPACKQYDYIDIPRKNQIATIARVNDGKKRVRQTLEAISLTTNKPKFKVIGGNVKHSNVNIECLGAFNKTSKIEIFSESKLAVQHWSGIPPAEAIQQYCPVISYDIPYMRELYGDALIWVEKDNVKKLAETIDYYLQNEKERKQFALNAYDMFINNKLGVKLEKQRANLVVTKIKDLLK